jgi:hypothetical protein
MANILTTGELEALTAPMEEAAPRAAAPEPVAYTAHRRFERFPGVLPIELEWGGQTHHGTTTDLGLGGLSALTHDDDLPEPGTRATVRFRLPAPIRHVEAAAEVRWSEDAQRSLGVRFEALRPEDVMALLTWFDTGSSAPIPPPDPQRPTRPKRARSRRRRTL